MIARVILAGVLAGAVSSLCAYTEGLSSTGAPPARRAGVEDLVFVVDTSAAAGYVNRGGAAVITPGSDPIAAIHRAAASWNDIADSRLLFSRFDQDSISIGRDNQNVITFRDDDRTRSMVGDATAVTSYFVIISSNTIVESDVIFNPDLRDELGMTAPFSTIGEPNAFDIEATLAHELGHVLGAKHSSVAGSSMWQNGRRGETFVRSLTPDDRMFAIQAYPTLDAFERYGRIRGVARFQDGAPIRGGLATAVDPNGTVVSAWTGLTSGGYEIVVPPGEYLVYIDPPNGPLGSAGLAVDESLLDVAFATSFFGGNDAPAPVAVAAGAVAEVDLTAPAGAPPLEIQSIGVRQGLHIIIGTGPRELPLDRDTELFLWGPGLDTVQEADVSLLGPEVELVPGSVRVAPTLVYQGMTALRLTVRPTVAEESTRSEDGSLGTILIRREGMAAVYTGGLVVDRLIAPPPIPSFSSSTVVNAASFGPGPVAPGEIVSIFGLDLGPAGGEATPGLDEQGFLPTSLAGVQVLFDGAPAGLFFVSSGQLNVQVPYALAGRSSTLAAVSYEGRRSLAAALPVAASAPGVFFLASGAPAIANQDGSINSPDNPEARGRAVVVFATGQGAVSPPVATAQAAPFSPLSAIDLSDVSATIGERPAQPLFAGLTPGFVGLLQINLLVPDDAPEGPRVPLAITVRGRGIQSGVTVAIAP